MVENRWNIEAIDALAIYESLKKQSHMEWVAFCEEDGTQVFPHTPEWKDAVKLCFQISRYAMDGNGYYVGYEYFTAFLPLYRKIDLNLLGIPYALSPYVVIKDTMDIEKIKPASELHEWTVEEAYQYLAESEIKEGKNEELTEDEIIQIAIDHGMAEGEYYPPDEEFVYHECEYTLYQTIEEMPDYKFVMRDGRRIWTLGDLELDLDKIVKNS